LAVGPPDSVLLLVNPAAGGGRAADVLVVAEEALEARGIAYRTVRTESLEHGCEEASRAAAEGETVAVISGDGLVGQIGGALAGSDATMALIPGGRGNDLARVLGVPVEPVAAVELLATGSVRDLDVAEVDGRRFLGVACCGLDSEANRIANETTFLSGNLVYAYAALRALIAWKPLGFELELDGRRRTLRGFSVSVANSQAYGGGMFIAPDAELDDGMLDVVSVSQVSKLRCLINLPKVFKGTHVENDEVTVDRAARVEVSAERPVAVYADGEHLADLPATFTVLPGALRMIAPPAPA
jgi:YegS/Rv2252/BmrU family lipid kinase